MAPAIGRWWRVGQPMGARATFLRSGIGWFRGEYLFPGMARGRAEAQNKPRNGGLGRECNFAGLCLLTPPRLDGRSERDGLRDPPSEIMLNGGSGQIVSALPQINSSQLVSFGSGSCVPLLSGAE